MAVLPAAQRFAPPGSRASSLLIVFAAPRVALGSGLAALAGAGLLLSGRLSGSVVTLVALATTARVAACAADGSPQAVRSMRAQIAIAPVWAAAVCAGAARAGSVRLADIRGAHAVAGIAVLRGSLLLVAASVCAASAIAAALVASRDESVLASRGAPAILEAPALAAQILLAVTLFAGPQISGASDVVPWIAGSAVFAYAATAWPGSERAPRVAWALGVAAFVLAMIGIRA